MRGGFKKLGLGLRALAIDFGNRDLGLLGVARVGASYAIWSFTIALGVYGFEAHGALGVGLIALVRLLPGAIAAPFAGLLVDRYSRRAVLLGSAGLMTLVLAGVAAAATMDAPIGFVYGFTVLFAIASCAYIPAESALIPGLCHSPQELSASNVTHSAMENTGFLLAAIGTGLILNASSTEVVFTVAAVVIGVTTVAILMVSSDHRPDYIRDEDEVAGVVEETKQGLRALFAHPALRLASLTLIALMFFEGFADVVVVVMALELLHLGDGSVGFLNAAWGIGALVGGAGLAMMLDRGKLVVAIAGGSLVLGAATMLPGFWPHESTAYLGWLAVGFGFTFVEVAAKTLMQRLGDDETMGRVIASLESARLSSMAVGSIAAILAIEILHPQNSLIVLGAVMPLFVLACWAKLRAFEVGAPVAEEHFQLLRHNSIFAPLPIATLERISHDLVAVTEPAGNDVIVQGEHGDRFFLIEEGQVEVFENGDFRRNEGPGESFGEIALLHDVPRTATVRTTTETRLLVLERAQFLTAVTGHRRSRQVAHTVVDDRWPGDQPATAPTE